MILNIFQVPLIQPSQGNITKATNPIFNDFYDESFPSLEADMEKAENQNHGKFY